MDTVGCGKKNPFLFDQIYTLILIFEWCCDVLKFISLCRLFLKKKNYALSLTSLSLSSSFFFFWGGGAFMQPLLLGLDNA